MSDFLVRKLTCGERTCDLTCLLASFPATRIRIPSRACYPPLHGCEKKIPPPPAPSLNFISLSPASLSGVIEACTERGDTDGALQILEIMRGARGTSHATSTTGANSRRSVCPRPSYRSYLAALTACSRAPVVLPSASTGDDANTKADVKKVRRGGEMGDWEASTRVLGMMWEDEAARKAEGQAAVPGVCGGGGLRYIRYCRRNVTLAHSCAWR